ncbi:hypothetical protein A2U01_0069597, partial [Trifolium medium]|nr:hypothetical protein [Trifolium medium]
IRVNVVARNDVNMENIWWILKSEEQLVSLHKIVSPSPLTAVWQVDQSIVE